MEKADNAVGKGENRVSTGEKRGSGRGPLRWEGDQTIGPISVQTNIR